jgi:hypothetical protein
MFDAYEPYTSESPISILTVQATGARILQMDSTYSQNLIAKASVASVSTLATSIDTRLAGVLAPSKIDVVGDDWSQIKIQSNSADLGIPSEIAFNRENKSQWLKSAMGVAGDLTRGAFWWVGGEDRLNINCETGVVRLKNGLQVSSIKTDIIESLTTGYSVRIEDRLVVGDSVSLESYLTVNGAFACLGDSAFSGNVRITGDLIGDVRLTGNLIVDGTTTFEGRMYNVFWLAIKCNWDGTVLTSTGRHQGTVNKFSADTGYDITFPAHPFGANYIVVATANEFTCFIRNQTSTSVRVHTRSATNTAATTANGDFNVMILA